MKQEPINRNSDTEKDRNPDIFRILYRYNKGSENRSLNIISSQASHPAEPNSAQTPEEISENTAALPKQMGYSSQRWPM